YNGICFSPDGRKVAAGGHLWRWWDATTRKPLARPDWAGKKCTGWLCNWLYLTFSPDGTRLAASLWADAPVNTIFLHDIRRRKVVASFDSPGSPAKVVLLSPDGKTVVGACGPVLRAWHVG